MRRWYRAVALVLLVTTVTAGLGATEGVEGAAPRRGDALALTAATTGGTGAAGGEPTGLPPDLGESPVRVTLVTGDRVTLMRAGGELATQVEPGPGRDRLAFATRDEGEHLYVVPTDAVGLLAAGRLDERLFDVAGLVAAGYDDARRADVPLIVQPETAGDRAAPDEAPAPVPRGVRTSSGSAPAGWWSARAPVRPVGLPTRQ